MLARLRGLPRRPRASGSDDFSYAIAGLAAAASIVAVNHVLMAPMLHLGARPLAPRVGPVLVPEPLDRARARRCSASSMAAFWGVEPVADPVRGRAAAADPPLAERPAAAGGGARRPEDGPLQRAPLRARAERGARCAPSASTGRSSLIMADLDLLRDINNTYGHLAGDAVLQGIAEVFRVAPAPLRRPGALRRRGVRDPAAGDGAGAGVRDRRADPPRRSPTRTFDVETSSEPIRATVSIGVAGFPRDGADANELIHQADLAVYRAKLQGRNRVLDASSEPLLMPETAAGPARRGAGGRRPHRAAAAGRPRCVRRARAPPSAAARDARAAVPLALEAARALRRHRQRRSASARASFGAIFGSSTDWHRPRRARRARRRRPGARARGRRRLDLGQRRRLARRRGAVRPARGARARDHDRGRRVERAPVAAPLRALQRRRAHALVARRGRRLHRRLPAHRRLQSSSTVAAGLAAGAAYFAVNMGLLSARGRDRGPRALVRRVCKERFAWLATHYLVYGFIGGVIGVAYRRRGPLRARRLRRAAPADAQDAGGVPAAHAAQRAEAPRGGRDDPDARTSRSSRPTGCCKERSTAAMESLSATVDARDAYTAGHSRRVQQLALAIGRELGLSQAELDLLGHAALFHDIGKLAIPDAILLKPASLTDEEWALMQRHADEGARIIDRLGFLNDAVPAIRHHHERFDGTGYPDGLKGEEIPLGARIIHVADALDSMLTTRIYRAARPAIGGARRAPPRRRHASSARAASRRSSGSCRSRAWTTRTTAPARARRVLVGRAFRSPVNASAAVCEFGVVCSILSWQCHDVSPGPAVPCARGHRPDGARELPGRHPQALLGRADPRRAARLRRSGWAARRRCASSRPTRRRASIRRR